MSSNWSPEIPAGNSRGRLEAGGAGSEQGYPDFFWWKNQMGTESFGRLEKGQVGVLSLSRLCSSWHPEFMEFWALQPLKFLFFTEF